MVILYIYNIYKFYISLIFLCRKCFPQSEEQSAKMKKLQIYTQKSLPRSMGESPNEIDPDQLPKLNPQSRGVLNRGGVTLSGKSAVLLFEP